MLYNENNLRASKNTIYLLLFFRSFLHCMTMITVTGCSFHSGRVQKSSEKTFRQVASVSEILEFSGVDLSDER